MTGSGREALRAQSASRSMSALESPPPETATAPGQGAPCASVRAIAAAKSAARLASLISALAATGFAHGFDLAEHHLRCVGIFRRQCAERRAAFVFLVHRD